MTGSGVPAVSRDFAEGVDQAFVEADGEEAPGCGVVVVGGWAAGGGAVLDV
jgi:hypothetical protein